MFPNAVVVGGDRAGPHVDVVAKARVADVAEVIHLAANGDHTLFNLNKIANFAGITNRGARSEMGEGTNLNSITNACIAHHGVHDRDIATEFGIVQQTAWT